MRLIHTARFEKDYSAAPTDVQRAFDKQERFSPRESVQGAIGSLVRLSFNR